MRKQQIQQIIREEVKAALGEAANPELDKAVDRFVKGLASKYSYKSSDAVMAVFEALKRLNMIHPSVEYKAPSGFSIAEGAMSELDILMDESPNFEAFLSKVKSDPKFKDIDPSSPEVKEFLQTLWDDAMGKGSTMGMAAEGKVSKSVIQKLVRESIDRKLRRNK